jgi:hypothetical protein
MNRMKNAGLLRAGMSRAPTQGWQKFPFTNVLGGRINYAGRSQHSSGGGSAWI